MVSPHAQYFSLRTALLSRFGISTEISQFSAVKNTQPLYILGWGSRLVQGIFFKSSTCPRKIYPLHEYVIFPRQNGEFFLKIGLPLRTLEKK